ncbi:MAG: CBU_0592 family membrane protein [Rickettsiales bacterium]
MNPFIIDAIGMCAPVLFLFAYAMISLGKWQAESLRFQAMNFFGAVALLISLTKDFNLPVFILESCWGIISVYGIIKALKARRRA